MADDTELSDPAVPARPSGPRVNRIPAGDDRERLVCPDCGFIDYVNPKIVVGAVCTWEDRFLLCRRAIPPRLGYWTIPAGYLETGETAAAGAARETWEEATADVEIGALLAVYDIPRISQVQMIFIGRMRTATFAPGPESQECRLFSWPEIPWNELAFPNTRWSLMHYRDLGGREDFAPRRTPPDGLADTDLD